MTEFHTKDFYRGNGPWRGIDGDKRKRVMSFLVDWIKRRRHNVVFSAIDTRIFDKRKTSDDRLKSLGSYWTASAMHILLSLQKEHMKFSKNKGHSIVIFDRQVRRETEFLKLAFDPPKWTNAYYGCTNNDEVLDQIVDVPHFVDSQHVVLIQIADLVAYILRHYAVLEEGLIKASYGEENEVMRELAVKIFSMQLRSATYPRRKRNSAQNLFWELCPPVLRGAHTKV